MVQMSSYHSYHLINDLHANSTVLHPHNHPIITFITYFMSNPIFQFSPAHYSEHLSLKRAKIYFPAKKFFKQILGKPQKIKRFTVRRPSSSDTIKSIKPSAAAQFFFVFPLFFLLLLLKFKSIYFSIIFLLSVLSVINKYW